MMKEEWENSKVYIYLFPRIDFASTLLANISAMRMNLQKFDI